MRVAEGCAYRRALAAVVAIVALFAGIAACTPAQQLLLSLVPDGTLSVLLGNLEGETDTNRRRVAALEQAGDWEGLANFADENLAKDRNNASWWLVAGYAHTRQKKHARAIECYQEMVRLEPQAPEGWNLLAQEYRLAGDSQRAVDVLTRALTALRDAPVTLFLLGESYSDLARYELAARAYRQALDLDNGLAPAWIGLARSHVRSGRLADAESIARSVEQANAPLAAAIRQEISAAAAR